MQAGRHTEKMRNLIEILGIKSPIPEMTENVESALETAIKEGQITDMDQTFQGLKCNNRQLKKESHELVTHLMKLFVELNQIREHLRHRPIVCLVGTKNVGKSSVAGQIFGLGNTGSGVSQSTMILKPHSWLDEVQREALVIDFPGSTGVLDVEQHACHFINIWWVWCMVFCLFESIPNRPTR